MSLDRPSLYSLEWHRVIELASESARSEPGRERVKSWIDPETWAPDVLSCQVRQQESFEISGLLEREAFWASMNGLLDPSALLEALGKGLFLSVEDLVVLRNWLYAIDAWAHVPPEELGTRAIRKAIAQLADAFQPLKILERIITPQGTVSEKASSKLAQLYHETRSLKREIEMALEQIVQKWDQLGVLQEKFTDFREGRYVVPVRVSDQSKVEGVICGTSSSRQSVFVEPKEVEVLNQRLRQKESDLSQEITEILLKTAKELRPFSEEIQASVSILTHWDAVQARARFARRYGGRTILVVEERVFQLSHSAHPLLWWSLTEDSITRNEIDFGDDNRVLLLTGPNTGGKTVLLKTLGLAAVFARTGFPFPGSDRIVVPFFDHLFLDVGDPQSIEEHLSSFSGHVLLLKRILEQVTPRSLVLLDELNSATDPQEGAALARAVLETLLERKTDGISPLIVATTHDPTLKTLAFSDPRIVNASMEFDEKSHSPTYRLAIGVPGRSRALDTAERLGIPAEVLTRARGYLSEGHIQVESLLSQLEKETHEAASARKEAVSIREQAEKLREEWQSRTGTGVQDLLDRTRLRLRQIVEQAQEEIRHSVRKLEETRTHRGIDESRRKINETFSQAQGRADKALSEEAPELAQALQLEADKKTPAPQRMEVGTLVRVPKWKSMGTILEMQGEKVRVQLMQGGKKGLAVNLSRMDLEFPSEKETQLHAQNVESTQRKNASAVKFDSPADVSEEIDLRGIRFEEGMAMLEGFLDRAFRSGRRQVKIIHGLGTGALREGARKILKKLPYVREARDGAPHEGGAGMTWVEFELK